MPTVALIILNWNRREDTLRCLASLERSGYPSADVFVVDNASTDDTVEAVRSAHPHVRIIENSSNLGYAGGNNTGIEAALRENYDYVLILNNDTVVDPDAIERLVVLAERHPEAGIVAPVICYLDEPERVWAAGGTIDWHRGRVALSYLNAPVSDVPRQPFATEHVTGCCMLLRAGAIRKAGLIDPRFFLYFEETEWCMRIARAGFTIMVEPSARIWHAIHPGEQEGSPAIAYYMTRNQLLFLKLSGAPRTTRLRALAGQLRTVASLYLRPHSNARIRGRRPMLRAIWDHAAGRYGPAPITRFNA